MEVQRAHKLREEKLVEVTNMTKNDPNTNQE